MNSLLQSIHSLQILLLLISLYHLTYAFSYWTITYVLTHYLWLTDYYYINCSYTIVFYRLDLGNLTYISKLRFFVFSNFRCYAGLWSWLKLTEEWVHVCADLCRLVQLLKLPEVHKICWCSFLSDHALKPQVSVLRPRLSFTKPFVISVLHR